MLIGPRVCFDCLQLCEAGFNLVVMSFNIDYVHKILQTGFTNRLQQNTFGGAQVQLSNTKQVQEKY